MIDITPLLNAIIAALATIITAVVIPRLKRWLDAKVGSERAAELCRWINIFVGAAEQMFVDPNEKKSYVCEKLEKMGYKVTDEVDGAIEAAVLQLHEALKDY